MSVMHIMMSRVGGGFFFFGGGAALDSDVGAKQRPSLSPHGMQDAAEVSALYTSDDASAMVLLVSGPVTASK